MKQIKLYLLTVFSLLFLTVWNFSCKKEITEPKFSEEPGVASGEKPLDPGFAENNMVMYWNNKVATVLSAPMNPPTRCRYFAIIEIAVHDALNNIKPKYQRYALNEREQFASPDAAVASAAYWAIKGLNRQGAFPVDSWYNESLATIPDGESKELGKTLGQHAAEAIITNRANDGLTQVIISSLIPADGDDPGEYRSTLPSANPALSLPHLKNIPNWGTVLRPFVVISNDQFRPAGPYPVNTEAYTQDYNEVKSKGAMIGHTRTAEESEIAIFWGDMPSFIWNRLARNIINAKKMDAWKTARLFALLHTAMADGINSNLESKYHFYYWRPETAIRLGDNDGNSNTAGDPDWLPSVIEVPSVNPIMHRYSPPLPEYPSSYSMFGGVVTEVLKLFFESNELSFDLTSLALPNVTRHYTSLSQAARDNSIGKIYAGWYFRKAVLDGEEMGRNIGSYVFNHSFRESGE